MFKYKFCNESNRHKNIGYKIFLVRIFSHNNVPTKTIQFTSFLNKHRNFVYTRHKTALLIAFPQLSSTKLLDQKQWMKHSERLCFSQSPQTVKVNPDGICMAFLAGQHSIHALQHQANNSNSVKTTYWHRVQHNIFSIVMAIHFTRFTIFALQCCDSIGQIQRTA